MHVQDDSPQAWSEPTWRATTNREGGIHYYNIYHDWMNPESGKNLKLLKGKEVGPFNEAVEGEDDVYHDG